MALFSGLSRHNHFGLLLLRLGIGAMMIYHGFPKLKGGPDMWHKIGGSMANLGVHDFPTFWGFMAAFAECIGGLLFLIGFLFRPACLLMLTTMAVAAMHHFHAGDGWGGASHALELGVVFLAMFIIGPGRYSIDKS
jgi:putative oxidoreductase